MNIKVKMKNSYKKLFLIIFLSILIVFIYGSKFQFQEPKYVGVTKCVSACHKTESQGKQLDIWKNSQHSKAWKTLETEQSKKIAIEKGYKENPTEIIECVKCHLLGREIKPDELTSTFEKEEGVQCESCHGPGSEYMKMSIMKDKNKCIEHGMIVYDNIESLCIICHNESSPTYKPFEFETSWNKIKHYKP
ncbi:MAG: cytochrome c family protein [Ignavibacteria bacterium]|nr:cytochrome c family protein [Ignavibacteria bacterium]